MVAHDGEQPQQLADGPPETNPPGVPTEARHLEHHKRLTSNYAAPTFSVDRLLACVFGKPASWNAEFDSAEQVKEKKEYYYEKKKE